jgi:hypothetical protein
MKTYHLQVITGNNSSNSGTYTTSCIADSYKISAGVYMFRDEDEYTVACYPVDRTIIYKIEYHDQVETH